MRERRQRPCVLVFAGHDPSGGAGIQADIEAISAQGAHALPIVTALTVQDNNRVQAVYPVEASVMGEQFEMLLDRIPIAAIKLGIVGSFENAKLIAQCVNRLQVRQPAIPVIVDPVLGSGGGDALAIQDALLAVQPVLHCATLITPNLPELGRLVSGTDSDDVKAKKLTAQFACDVLLKGGHGATREVMPEVINHWFEWQHEQQMANLARSWIWPRISGAFHGTGCTLAAAIAARLAMGESVGTSLTVAQSYVQRCLEQAYVVAPGQLIPARYFGTTLNKEII